MVDRRKFRRWLYEHLEAAGPDNGTATMIDRVLICLIIGNLLSVILETVPSYASEWRWLFAGIEWLTVTIFAVEYSLRVYVATLHPPLRRYRPLVARLHYVVQPHAVIDFIAFAPTLIALALGLDDLNVLVVFRLLRFLKLARYSPGMRSLLAAIASERRAIVASAVLMAGLILSAATLMYLLERNAQPDQFGSIPGAMYWAVTTLTTVGYGDEVPITPAGKVLAGFAMLAGLCMFALPVGIIATAFAREIHARDFVVTWGMVARVPIFADLEASEIAEVAKLLRAQTVAAGTMITSKGAPAYAMYFIAAGLVEVDGPNGTVRLSDGAFFGEMAVIRRGKRLADVKALSECRLLVLEADALHMLMSRETRIGRHIRSVAAQRLKAGGLRIKGDILSEELEVDEAGPAWSGGGSLW